MKKIWLDNMILVVGLILTLFISTSVQKVAAAATNDITTFAEYIQIEGGCNFAYQGICVNMRSGPGTNYPVVAKLRDGIVLRVGDSVVTQGRTWYKIIFTTELRYPERISDDVYVAQTDAVHFFNKSGDEQTNRMNASTTKRIVINISQQMLYAYDGDTRFMQEKISTGLKATPTPHGTFFVYKKTPSRYMQGPLPDVSDQYYDLPGVPWDLYFSKDGAVIHGAYWHVKFGQPWSHGCVNLPPDKAETLYSWAEIGMPVIVKN